MILMATPPAVADLTAKQNRPRGRRGRSVGRTSAFVLPVLALAFGDLRDRCRKTAPSRVVHLRSGDPLDVLALVRWRKRVPHLARSAALLQRGGQVRGHLRSRLSRPAA